MRCPEILIIGAGVMGAASAYALAKHGYKVLVIDRDGVASGASGAAEGIVGSVAKRQLGLVTSMVVESFGMFDQLSEELDNDVEFAKRPGLMVIDEESQLDILERFVSRKKTSGLDIELLDREATHEIEPLLPDEIIGAVYTPAQGIVNPLKLTYSYLVAAYRLGAAFSLETPIKMNCYGNRIGSVITSKGEIAPFILVNAAGSGAENIAGLAGVSIRILPKRVHMIVSEALPAGTLRNTIYCARNVIGGLNPKTLEFEDAPTEDKVRAAEVVSPWQLSSFTQTKNGNILFCGGFGFAGTAKVVDPNIIKVMAKNIVQIIPAFSFLPAIRTWVGFEPCTPDNLPIVGRATNLENFYFAAGHGNAGVMMSPVTGVAVAELISEGKAHFSLDSAQPDRFEKTAKS